MLDPKPTNPIGPVARPRIHAIDFAAASSPKARDWACLGSHCWNISIREPEKPYLLGIMPTLWIFIVAFEIQ